MYEPTVDLERPVRVLRLITRLNIGGPSIQAIELSNRLQARGFQTVLVHGRLGPAEGDMRYLVPRSVDARYLPLMRRAVGPVSDLRALLTLYRLVRRVRPAIVHTHMAKAGTLGRLATAMYNRTARHADRARLVHTYHGHVLEGYFKPAVGRAIAATERQLARMTDAIVTISPAIQREIRDEYRIGRPDQHVVIRLGFDLRPFVSIDPVARASARQLLQIPSGAPVVTSVGRLTAIKDHRLFIETARLLTDHHADVLFLIVGDGELRRDLETATAEQGLSGRVRFLGWVRDLAPVYAATDVFLLTSRNEGTPVAVIESLASGAPAVSADIGGVGDVIEHHETGFIAPTRTPAALADLVNALLVNKPQREKMGKRGRERMIERYGIHRLVDEVEALYRGLLAGRHDVS